MSLFSFRNEFDATKVTLSEKNGADPQVSYSGPYTVRIECEDSAIGAGAESFVYATLGEAWAKFSELVQVEFEAVQGEYAA